MRFQLENWKRGLDLTSNLALQQIFLWILQSAEFAFQSRKVCQQDCNEIFYVISS
jgi:hypothetical protein